MPQLPSNRTTASNVDRRSALAALSLGSLAGIAACSTPGQRGQGFVAPPLPGFDSATGRFSLPPLPYDVAALEPHIDAQTMSIHHGKHHQGYVNGLNKALDELDKARASGDFGLIKHWSREVSFHGGGHINHTLFWLGMAPAGKGGGGQPGGALAQAIQRDFGSFDGFAAQFKAASNAVEGSGWGWLVREPSSNRLMIVQVEKQQDMMPAGWQPILGIDVWEHAYYIKYQNRRADYVNAFFNVINWSRAEELFGA